MTPFLRLSPFIEPVAVEAWDAWFRWRDRGGLHDVAIEDTWWRVAVALAAAQTDGSKPRWLARFVQALASWQLLPDERLLEAAGSGTITWRDGDLHAVVNMAAFVSVHTQSTPRIDPRAISACAQMAVHALDNAAVLAGSVAPRPRVGMTGVADALLLLGVGYDSDAGRAQAVVFARALAEGCQRANVTLARERGAAAGGARHDLRHRPLTAITSQPRLALLANDVADALDPLLGANHRHTIAGPDGPRSIRASGYALRVLQAGGNPPEDSRTLARDLSVSAQLAMRAAVQPWMDIPIDYPLLLETEPGPEQQVDMRRQAGMLGLGDPAWRTVATLQDGEPPAVYAGVKPGPPAREASS